VGTEPDDHNSFVEALSYLPYPHIICGTTVFADFSDATRSASEIADLLSGETETPGQGELTEFESTNSNSGSKSNEFNPESVNPSKNRNSGEKSEVDGSSGQSGQTGLTAFT
jgi:hypothetical protein